MMRHAEDDKSSNRKGFDGHFRFGCSGKASVWRLHLSGENHINDQDYSSLWCLGF